MQDEKITLKVEGLKPGSLFTLHSYTSTASPGKLFESVACYKSDEQGSINLDKDKSLMGSYQGVEPMGLFWSMQPSPANKHKFARFAKMDVTTPLVVDINIFDTGIKDVDHLHQLRLCDNLKEEQIASKQLNRLYMKPGTKRIPLNMKKHGIHGTLFIPPGEGPFPGVITMFGGHPGTMEFKASLLASHGFASLALAFHGVEGLPGFGQTKGTYPPYFGEAKLEYFEKAVDFLINHESVRKTSGVGVLTVSGSTPIGLLMAVHFEHVRCVTVINGPSYVNYADFTYKEFSYKCIDFNYSEPSPKVVTGYTIDVPDPLNPSPPECFIDFASQHQVAFLFLVAEDDRLTPSSDYADAAQVLLDRANHPDYKIVRYPGAGHLIEPPYAPLNRESWFPALDKLMIWGGNAEDHKTAQESAWKEQIDFLNKNLQ